MSGSSLSPSFLLIGALALSMACSPSAAKRQPVTAPAESVAPAIERSAAAGASTASGALAAEAPERSDARSVRSSPIEALEQMVTAQALLVSLLLAPLSKDRAEPAVARVELPPRPSAH